MSTKGEFPLLDFFDPKKMIVTKEWAKLFLENWNRAVWLWDSGRVFENYQGYYGEGHTSNQMEDQQAYARICCSWIIPHGMAEPHVVAYEMPVNCSCDHCKVERALNAFDDSPDLPF